MFEQALTKCPSVFFIVFSIYPIETFPSIVVSQKEYLVDKQSVYPSYAQSILQTTKSPILGSVRTSSNLDSESGFDLTPEEYQKFKIWEKGDIPFYIDIPSFSDKSIRDKIRWFLNEVNAVTKLNFMELPRPPTDYNEKRWVYFLNRQSYLGCHDVSMTNFTLKGVQRVVLGYDCLATGGGLAEIVLALAGVPPQHNAPDRDKYIEILEENIIPEKKYLFKKLDNHDWLFHNLAYDFDSAGHFHQHKHSVKGSATIMLKSPYKELHTSIGVQKGFSEMDIFKINLLYTYIVKKSKTYMPACRKLFAGVDDSNKEYFSSENLEPVRKPNKYLGIEDKEESDTERSEKEESDKEGYKDGSDKQGSEKERSDQEESNKEESEKKGRDKEGSIKEESDKSNGSSSLDESGSDKNVTSNTPNDSKSNPEGHSSEFKRKLKLLNMVNNEVNSNNKPKLLKSYKDPLSYLSDYDTDDNKRIKPKYAWRKRV